MISFILHSLLCVYWPRMLSILLTVPCELKENVCILLSLDEIVCSCQLYPFD